MTRVSTTDLLDELAADETHYLEVLSEDSMSVELARYPNPEPKHPHKVDELYFVVSGSATARVGTETYPVADGDVVFVEQGVEHEFFDIEDELTTLIVFAGAEDSVLGTRP